MKLLIQLLALICLVCAEIELSVKETTKGINATCHPGVDHLWNVFRRWNICLPDNECVDEKHRNADVNYKLIVSERPVITLVLHPIQPSDDTFVATVTVMHGNVSTGNTSAGNITLSCGVKKSEGLVWSDPVQINSLFTSDPPTKDKTEPPTPGSAHPSNTSRPSGSDALITAIPAKYVMFMCIALAAVLMGGLA